MDLSICLYCEKHLPEENMSFCSIDCQANEASKPSQYHHEQQLSNDYYFYNSSISSSRSTCSSNSDISFHRRLSFSSSLSSSSLSSLYPTTTAVKHPSQQQTKRKLMPTKTNDSKNVKTTNSFLFTNTSIFLLDHIQDLNKNYNQNVYTNQFFS